jgi:hypothetical protein
MIALYIGGGIVVLLIVLALLAPKETNIERVTEVPVGPDQVYEHMRSLKTFVKWSPWSGRDPNSEVTYGGTDGEVGSTYNWKGNKEVGEGQMAITELNPGQKVGVKLRFFKPWKSEADTAFIIQGDGDRSKLSWTFHSENKLPSSIFMLFMNMDKMLGGDFEQGLANYQEFLKNEGLWEGYAES